MAHTIRYCVALAAVALFATPEARADDAALKSELKAMDTDGDSRISREEHAQGARDKFTRLDGDADGRVTATEMSSAKGGESLDEKAVSEKISSMDTNGDGALTTSEHEGGVSKKFDEMDANQDGYLVDVEIIEEPVAPSEDPMVPPEEPVQAPMEPELNPEAPPQITP